MSHLRTALLPLALSLTACASTDAERRSPTTLLVTGRVTVEAFVTEGPDGPHLQAVSARGVENMPSRLVELSVIVFDDRNDDGVVDEPERRAAWHVRSSTGTARLIASGSHRFGTGDGTDAENVKLEVRVRFATDDGSVDEDSAVVPFEY